MMTMKSKGSLLVMCGGWVAVAILLNIALQTQLT